MNNKATPSGGSGQSPEPLPTWRYVVWMLVVVVFAYYYWSSQSVPQVQEITYTEFKQQVRDEQVAQVTLQGDKVRGRFRSAAKAQAAEQGTSRAERFTTTLPPVDDADLIPLLEQHDVTIKAESAKNPWWAQAIIALLPWILIIGLFFYISRKWQERMGQGGGGLFGFGQSKAKRYHKGSMNVTFDDVAGLKGAKQDLQEITAYLKDPDQFRELGAKVPKGILLMGPPGTGKTLLAKAVAGEADVPFYSISGSQFIEMFVGVGASRVRDMFKDAKDNSPAIIFIDEIDSIGRARGTGVGGGHDEREQTLNQILNEMDGFDPHEAVVVLAATNRPDVLDNALLRPGRFDRKVVLERPDKKARLAILKVHTRETPLADDVDLERLAALTVGFAGADLENMVNEAALLAGRQSKHKVDMEAMLAARDKVVLGARRESVISEDEKEIIAFHECGHALSAALLPHADPLDKVTIIPRGQALGATEQIPEEERYNLREDYLRDRIGVMLGGRLAEKLIYDQVSSGAQEDLKQATRLARHMVIQWGMSDKLGPVAFSRGEEHVFLGKEMTQQRDFSEHTAEIIDEEICALVKDIEARVYKLLEDHREQLTRLANTLLEKETLEADEIRAIVEGDASATQQPSAAGRA